MISVKSPSMIRRFGTGLNFSDSTVGSEEAYDTCDEITRQCSKSFYFSTAFLPEAKRRAIRAFYAFCRVTDDMVDVPTGSVAHELRDWRLAARLPARAQRNPVLRAWAETRERYGVPQKYAEELIDGCEMDLTINRYDTFDELKTYCYRVASTVGLISMHIIGINDDDPRLMEASIPAAVDLGIALQLTNILRDVGEDLSRGRIYLPGEDLRRFAYTENDLRAGLIDDRFRDLMRYEIDRAGRLYDQGWPGIASLKQEGRLAVGAAINLYRGILGRIEDNGFDVFSKRAHLNTFEKIRRMPGIYWRVRQLHSSR